MSKLGQVSKREDLEDWVTDDPLLDPPEELSQCAAASKEAAALMCYFRHKRVAFQREFFALRAKQHATHQHYFHRIPSRCFWISIGAALLHFTLELVAGGLTNEKLRHFLELVARWSIVVAAATPAVGAGVRTWLLAFEFGRSALLYRAQRSCLDKRLDALQRNSPDGIFVTIWFTEQALEEEHRSLDSPDARCGMVWVKRGANMSKSLFPRPRRCDILGFWEVHGYSNTADRGRRSGSHNCLRVSDPPSLHLTVPPHLP